jgi:hypothetical protein
VSSRGNCGARHNPLGADTFWPLPTVSLEYGTLEPARSFVRTEHDQRCDRCGAMLVRRGWMIYVFRRRGLVSRAPKLRSEATGLGTGRSTDVVLVAVSRMSPWVRGCRRRYRSCPSPRLRRRLLNQHPRMDFVLGGRPQRERPRSCADRGRTQRLSNAQRFPRPLLKANRALNVIASQITFGFSALLSVNAASPLWGRVRILRGETGAVCATAPTLAASGMKLANARAIERVALDPLCASAVVVRLHRRASPQIPSH